MIENLMARVGIKYVKFHFILNTNISPQTFVHVMNDLVKPAGCSTRKKALAERVRVHRMGACYTIKYTIIDFTLWYF